MLYMVVAHFKNQDALPVYRRYHERGRLATEGLTYVSSWVDEKLCRCLVLMQFAELPCIPLRFFASSLRPLR